MGAPISLAVAGLLAICARSASVAEREGPVAIEAPPPEAGDREPPAGPAEPAPTG